jgi:acetyl esterase/lipase
MKIFRTVTIIAALAGVQSSGSAVAQSLCVKVANSPLVQPSPQNLEGADSYVYKTVQGTDLRVYVFPPAEARSGRHAAVVFFFGGGWMIGNVTSLTADAQYFARRGITAILADYRTYCRNGAGIVAQMADAKSAVRWVRGHADELGIDAQRIAVSGGSSGGHLALGTAMFPELDAKGEDESISSRPDLLVLFYPCVDETTAQERATSADAIGSHGRDVSPLYHVRPGLPPTLIFQGTADALYPENLQYCRQARAKNNECELIQYDRAPHGFMNRAVTKGPWYEQGLRGMDDFLVRKGYLAAPQPARAPHS